MINNINVLTTALLIIAGIMVVLLIILAVVYIKMKAQTQDNNKRTNQEIEVRSKETKNSNSKVKQYTVDSVFDFMEFDKIEDNMIVQKSGKKYVMIVECQGINYDLMSQEEKVSVEEGFSQFLNTLKEPIQLYIQTRRINLERSIQNYKEKVNDVEKDYAKQKLKYEQLSKDPNISEDILNREYYELIKQKNLYEYGKDIIYNTERMSLNKNILNEKYYVVISYRTENLDQENLDKDEVKELAFSELYTKAKSIIRALSASSVIGKIMTSSELADLLYVAYNRDDSDNYGIERARRAGFDELYSTATDYMDKKMKLLDDEIDKKAYELASKKILEAQSEKNKKYNEKKDDMDDIIANLAELYISQNTGMIGKDVAKSAKEKVKKTIRKETKDNVQKETKSTKRVSSES